MKQTNSIIAILAFAVLLLAPSCSKKDPLVGKWKEEGKTETIEFLVDTEGKPDRAIMSARNGVTIAGTWEWVGENKDGVLLELSGPLGTLPMMMNKIKFEGDKLIFTPSMGPRPEPVTMIRVKD
jgi:hypothetical protein